VFVWWFFFVTVACRGCGLGVVMCRLVGNVPGLMDVFSMEYLDGKEWALVLGFTPICSIVDELTKCVYRATGFGQRPKARNANAAGIPATRRGGDGGESYYVALNVEENKKQEPPISSAIVAAAGE